MRISNLLRGLLVVFAAISPFVLHAQFQPPNPDELKMTSDPKAPGADAVYLDFEENDSDARQSHNYYARIKVLTEKGKEAATVEIPYYGGAYSIGSVSGRTIHPDGTIVPLNVKPEDLLVVKTDEARLQKKVFTMPSVEVGSVLEFTYQLRENAQFYWHFARDWDVQQEILQPQGPFLLRALAGCQHDLLAPPSPGSTCEGRCCRPLHARYHRRPTPP